MPKRKKRKKRKRSNTGLDRKITLYYPALSVEDIAPDLDFAYAQFEVSYMYLRFLSEPITALTSLDAINKRNKSTPGSKPHPRFLSGLRLAE